MGGLFASSQAEFGSHYPESGSEPLSEAYGALLGEGERRGRASIIAPRRANAEVPRFVQGVYRFEGEGLEDPIPLQPEVVYELPRERHARLIYLRAGNSAGELIYLLLCRDSHRMRYFPIGARSALHVQLAILEDLTPGSRLELFVGAEAGVKGCVTLDLGLIEF